MSSAPTGRVRRRSTSADWSAECAGEWLTIALMKRAVRLLTTDMRYGVPEQDLRIDLSRLPTVPKSRFVISNVALRP